MSGLGKVGRAPSPTPDQGLWGHDQHMYLGCLYLKRRGLWTLPSWMPTTRNPWALLTFFKTDSRCFLVIPEWRQAAFRHEGRSDTCRCNAVTAQHNTISPSEVSQRHSTLWKQMHQKLGAGRKCSEPATSVPGPGIPGGQELDGEHQALGSVTLRKMPAGH